MGMTELYFAPANVGDTHDGSTPQDAAALFEAGNWSSHITTFNFNGTDGLLCRIMPGAYTCSQSLASTLWTGGGLTAPTATLPLILHGCNSNGSLLTPPDPNWQSCQPAWDTAAGWDSDNWPVIATTTNIYTIDLVGVWLRLIKLTASARTGSISRYCAGLDWVALSNSTNNASTSALGSGYTTATNCVASCSGDNYQAVVGLVNGEVLDNCQVVGVAGAGSTRIGVQLGMTTGVGLLSRCAIINNGGTGVLYAGSTAGVIARLWRCVIANNGGSGIAFPNTAAQTGRSFIDRCLITGNGAYGIDPGGANTNLVVTNCRLRDNDDGNFGTFGNYPTNFNNYTTDTWSSTEEADAAEYVDSATTKDFRIKYGSSIWGKNYGVADEVPPLVKKVTMTGGI